MNTSDQFIRVTGVSSRATAPSLTRFLDRVQVRASGSPRGYQAPAQAAAVTTTASRPAADSLGEIVTLCLRSS